VGNHIGCLSIHFCWGRVPSSATDLEPTYCYGTFQRGSGYFALCGFRSPQRSSQRPELIVPVDGPLKAMKFFCNFVRGLALHILVRQTPDSCGHHAAIHLESLLLFVFNHYDKLLDFFHFIQIYLSLCLLFLFTPPSCGFTGSVSFILFQENHQTGIHSYTCHGYCHLLFPFPASGAEWYFRFFFVDRSPDISLAGFFSPTAEVPSFFLTVCSQNVRFFRFPAVIPFFSGSF